MRYAVYYVPGDDTPLGRFGAQLFGRWPNGEAEPVRDDHPERLARTGRAARYGFHATLKAPFRLHPEASVAALLSAVEALAATLRPVPLEPLRVDRHGLATLALCLAEPQSTELVALAERCVRELDRFRAPLNEAERARRRPERLSPEARERLERWGYPWVLDGFRFHLTLARGGEGEQHFLSWLHRRVAAAELQGAALDRLAVCREAAPGAPLLRIAQWPLGNTG